jgi:hypothetical protein
LPDWGSDCHSQNYCYVFHPKREIWKIERLFGNPTKLLYLVLFLDADESITGTGLDSFDTPDKFTSTSSDVKECSR